MASLLHVAVGAAAGRVAAGRPSLGHSIGWALLSMLPDADVIAFTFGIAYGAPFGHRGASHSIAFAGLCGLVALALTRGKLRISALAALVVLSHPLLDALTSGGYGVALFWPVSDARIFFPWRPIPVAPIGWGFLSPYGLKVALAELGPSLPLLVAACWPRRDGS